MRAPDTRLETENYLVTHYHDDPARIVVAFASAGMDGLGEPIEEFRTTLRSLGPSTMFVIDRKRHWYNHQDTRDVFTQAAAIVDRYVEAGCLGESMGGSGAILFSRYCPRVSRVLAFAPQYSIASPFIDFDQRFRGMEQSFPHRRFADFAETPIPRVCQILYGNTEWLDFLHAAMFQANNFPVTYVNGAGHLVARHLKRGAHDNLLLPLVREFCVFGQPFTQDVVRRVLGELCTPLPLLPGYRFADALRMEEPWRESPTRPLPPPPAAPLISLNKPAEQSSISAWSRGATTRTDAAGANNGKITGSYAFHTDEEDGPWWSVDLGSPFAVQEIRLYNRIDNLATARRARHFELLVRLGARDWTPVFRKTDGSMFGGADGMPFIWHPGQPVRAEQIRVRLIGRDFLHLDQVEVYGEPVPAQPAG